MKREESIFSANGFESSEEFVGMPWLNQDGSYKTDKEIELLGKGWSYQVWDAYFKSIEGYQRESQISSQIALNNVSADECANIFYSVSCGDGYPHLKIAVRGCLNRLTQRQQDIIRMTFWEKKSQYEIAEVLNIKRPTVQSNLRDAKKKIKQMLVKMHLKRMSDQVIHLAS